ncbi:hypothetical protein WQ54_16325 [Bacillus sp. SA1-12]|nr:hypothetical protein WQ54_16325 [Bacillus sp. SA1-12]
MEGLYKDLKCRFSYIHRVMKGFESMHLNCCITSIWSNAFFIKVKEQVAHEGIGISVVEILIVKRKNSRGLRVKNKIMMQQFRGNKVKNL